jgi:hypothetical protein
MLYTEIIAVFSEIHNNVANDTLRGAMNGLHQGVLYFQNAIHCHGTRVNAISFLRTRTLQPSVYRFSQNSQMVFKSVKHNYRQ